MCYHGCEIVITGKSKQPKNNKSFYTLFEHHKDPLMIAKLQFFKHFASLLKPFLIHFQKESSMVPFLATDFDRMMRQIHGLFMKRDVVNEANTSYLLSQVDVSKKENDFPLDSLDLRRVRRLNWRD